MTDERQAGISAAPKPIEEIAARAGITADRLEKYGPYKAKVLFLDAKNQILEEKTLFEGTVDSSAVYPREIIRDALRFEASALVFVHNHPSGDPEPSLCDKEITRDLVFAARVMQLKVLDHIIIGNNRYFSFADQGLIEEYEFQSSHSG